MAIASHHQVAGGGGVAYSSPMPTVPYVFTVPIRFSHCDPAGIVYFPHYFSMFNDATEAWFADGLGIDYRDMIENRRRGMPRAHASCDFVRPATMGDVLTLSLRVTEVGRTSFKVEIVGEVDGTHCLTGRLAIVSTSLEDHRPVPLEPDMRDKLLGYMDTEPTG